MNAENPMAMRPRLHQGTLTVEAPRLSLRMASAIAAAARAAVSGPMRAAAPHAGGGALAALEALLAPMRTSSLDTPSPGASATTHSGTAGTGPSSLNAAAVAASLRNAATFPEADTTAFSQGRRSPGTGMTAAGGGGGGSAGSAGSTGSSTRPIASVADASPAEASALIAELGARVVHPQVIYAQRLRAHTRARPLYTHAPLLCIRWRMLLVMACPHALPSHWLTGSTQAPLSQLRVHATCSLQDAATARDGWSALAGGEGVRRAVEEALLWPLRHPDAFTSVLRHTRAGSAPPPVRPTALLFYGPPGTGKTHAARIAAESATLPLVSAPLEGLISKWYGEGEKQLALLFACCERLGPCVLFLDEVDALAGSRERGVHEASRRMLSVLLRHLDGACRGRPWSAAHAHARTFDCALGCAGVVVHADGCARTLPAPCTARTQSRPPP